MILPETQIMDFIAQTLDRCLEAAGMDAVDALRSFFVLAAATTISVSIPSSLRSRFLVYGPRAKTQTTPTSRPSSGLLDYLATWRVPHSYFAQFYIASLLSSLFWAWQLLTKGTAFLEVASRVSPEHLAHSMSVHQVVVCWILITIQATRRVWESYAFSKPSTSQMWVVHWILGLYFYLATAVAIWIEGSGQLVFHDISASHFNLTIAPTLRTFLCVPFFLVASGIQHDCHHYLSTLKTYAVPNDHPMFRGVVCPHYGAECLIYLSLAILAAPPGQLANKTLLACLGFVVVNLGITAKTTKQWYIQTLGAEVVQGWWLMIPFVY